MFKLFYFTNYLLILLLSRNIKFCYQMGIQTFDIKIKIAYSMILIAFGLNLKLIKRH